MSKKRLLQLRERQREEFEKKAKAGPPSYQKKRAATKKRQAARRHVPKSYRKAVNAFGMDGIDTIEKRSGYYAGRAAVELIKLGAKPAQDFKDEDLPESIKVTGPRIGWYRLTIDGKREKKKYRYAQVKRLQRKIIERDRVRAIAAKIGVTPDDVKRVIRKIYKQEAKKTARFKKSKKYKAFSSKKRRSLKVKNRVSAVLAAMSDLLQIHGSPKALRGDREQVWKKINGEWAVKEGRVWVRKVGADMWERVRVRGRRKTKGGKRK